VDDPSSVGITGLWTLSYWQSCTCIKIETWCTRKRNRQIVISMLQIVYLGTLSWRWSWHSMQKSKWFRCRQSVLIGQTSTCTVAPPVWLVILGSDLLARKESVHVVLMKHSWVSFHRSLQPLITSKFNTPVLHFSKFGVRFIGQALCNVYCSAQKPSCGYCGYLQGQVHIRMFQLDPTSLPCHCSRHVENLKQISCCIKQWDAATTSTTYTPVASCMVIDACFVHYGGFVAPKFVWENLTAYNIIMIDFRDFAAKCLDQPRRFPGTGSNTFVMRCSMYTRCTLYS